MSRAPRRDRATWTDAGLELLAEGGGLGAVAVEPLATRLGATKGSFYWHFADREALIAAMLDRWRERHTEAVIALVADEPDPARRLHRLFRQVMIGAATGDQRVELSLLASTDRADVATALRVVTERRIDFVTDCYVALGLDLEPARRAAILAYTAFAGLLHAQHATGGHLLDSMSTADYLDHVERVLGLGIESLR